MDSSRPRSLDILSELSFWRSELRLLLDGERLDVSDVDEKRVSDWERAVVVWNKGNDSAWVPAELFLSQHSGYQKIAWGDIKSTFDTRDATKPRGGCDGQKHLDHPKV